MLIDDSHTSSLNSTEFLKARLSVWNTNGKIQVQVYGTGQVIDNVTVYNIAGIISRASIGSDVFLFFPYGDHSNPHAIIVNLANRVPLPDNNDELVLYDQATGETKVSIVDNTITLYGEVLVDRQDGMGAKKVALQGDLDTNGDKLL